MELNVGESSAVLFFVNQQQQQLCSPGWVQRNGQGKYKSTRQNTEKNALSCQNSWFVSTVDVARKEDACVLCSESVQRCQMIFLQTRTCETAFVGEQVLNCLENEKKNMCVRVFRFATAAPNPWIFSRQIYLDLGHRKWRLFSEAITSSFLQCCY